MLRSYCQAYAFNCTWSLSTSNNTHARNIVRYVSLVCSFIILCVVRAIVRCQSTWSVRTCLSLLLVIMRVVVTDATNGRNMCVWCTTLAPRGRVSYCHSESVCWLICVRLGETYLYEWPHNWRHDDHYGRRSADLLIQIVDNVCILGEH